MPLLNVDEMSATQILALTKTDDGTYNQVEYVVGYCFKDEIYTLQGIRLLGKVRNQAIKHGLSELCRFWKDEQEAKAFIEQLGTNKAEVMDARLGGDPADVNSLTVFPVHHILEYCAFDVDIPHYKEPPFGAKDDGSYNKVEFVLGYTLDKQKYSLQNMRVAGKIRNQSIALGLTDNGPFYKDSTTARTAITKLQTENKEIMDSRLGGDPADLNLLQPLPVHRKLQLIQQV